MPVGSAAQHSPQPRLCPGVTDAGARRDAWLRAATTIRLYREKHAVTGARPLGNPDAITDRAQAHDYRAAQDAYQRARRLGGIQQPAPQPTTQRPAPEHGYGPSL